MKSKRAILIICDSLRRDLVTARTCPTLTGLAQASTWFSRAGSVFPSTTRVSSASIATGCRPARHGLLGNCMLLREADGLANHSAGDPGFVERLRAATGHALRVPTLAQRLAAHGGAAIYSNVSPGAAYFHDPDGHGRVYHRAGSYGPGRRPYSGAEALEIASGAAGDAEMTRRFCAMLQAPGAPAMATLWLSEPDHSGHGHALGSPAHLAAIAHAERCVAQVLDTVDALRARGEDILLMVGSDHGMETVLGEIDVAAALVQAGLKDSPDSRELVVAPNGTACVIGIAPDAAARTAAVAAFLRRQAWCGQVFGGAALAGIGMPQDDPACALAVTMRHDPGPNAHGVPGAAWIAADRGDAKRYDGRGQHGGLGPNEQAPFLIAQGAGFAAGAVCDQAVSLIDYAPTVLRHLGLPADGMDGRPLPHSFPAPSPAHRAL
ncbi:alkaline phosphatase family protein [Bordetella bronchiseptica]|uniref:Alkaline phosphatase family protein n=2 Tax=Bordetella bronchiseptica TaxID=518 RepID=A0A0C6P3G3_BORBO|nr:alkaline phosphatase family protein [Bordetella bronchiseptica]SHR12725.1 Type I phosphodiesterase/nucleotide pyrophosphatase [Mycobacteroides abscessus subsp. abscessus]AWP73850.1 alkaline phosphatase family protein [Bordetella bronchiseptica]AWP78678.1 alkaline phosphatase family protein [Bordetella bronchiseptica]AWP83494.1 alkaline phosphatase family protein [Bordetella bronchiseptica]AWQ09061.1 alkaline phosphatase family protein [Bordetella bronchiseptica]